MGPKEEQAASKVVAEYIAACKKRAEHVSDGRFSLKDSWEIQRRSLLKDLLITPVNSAWSIPYMTIKKGLEVLDKLGVTWAAKVSQRVPPGIRTGYQKEMEYLICRDVLDWNLYKRPRLLPEALEKVIPGTHAKSIRALVDQFSNSRALVSDLSSTGITFLFAKVMFGDTSLGLKSMAYLFAKKKAHDEAASHFFLGKSIGNAFYDVVPAAVNESDVRLFFAGFVVLLTVLGMICSVVSDPIRKKLGLHERRLNILLDEIEKELIYLSHKTRT